VGAIVADAAAQPTHWNYKVTYYHDQLRMMHRWDSPEFACPSLNAYYTQVALYILKRKLGSLSKVLK